MDVGALLSGESKFVGMFVFMNHLIHSFLALLLTYY